MRPFDGWGAKPSRQASRATGVPELEELLELDELELLEELELDEFELDDEDELDDSPGSVPPPHAANRMLNKPAPTKRVENPLLIRMLMKIPLHYSEDAARNVRAAFYSALLYCRKFHIWGNYSHRIRFSAIQHTFFCWPSQIVRVNFFLSHGMENRRHYVDETI
jgi:hypothetical protein